MHITFSPMRQTGTLALSRHGDILTINGEAFDFSGISEGARLPREAIASDWVAGDVHRADGILTVPLILPHGPDAPPEARFPAALTLELDGPVTLPAQFTE